MLRERRTNAEIRAPRPRIGSGFSDDLQLALYLCYESHYSDVHSWIGGDEWDPQLIAFRRALEAEFLECLQSETGVPAKVSDMRAAIKGLIAADDGPSVSRYMEHTGTLDQMRQFVVHRSAYQLKEGDGHTFAIPRLEGRAKQLLVEIQAGEYGADGPDRTMHAELFAGTMRALGLDDRRHAYLDRLPASALMISNVISLFGLNRRWCGALVGHLTVFEMTSVEPMRRYSAGLDRMGAPDAARRFYDVHVLADAEHEVLALEMAGALAEEYPALAADVVFGARSAIVVETMFANDLLSRWSGAMRGRPAA